MTDPYHPTALGDLSCRCSAIAFRSINQRRDDVRWRHDLRLSVLLLNLLVDGTHYQVRAICPNKIYLAPLLIYVPAL